MSEFYNPGITGFHTPEVNSGFSTPGGISSNSGFDTPDVALSPASNVSLNQQSEFQGGVQKYSEENVQNVSMKFYLLLVLLSY